MRGVQIFLALIIIFTSCKNDNGSTEVASESIISEEANSEFRNTVVTDSIVMEVDTSSFSSQGKCGIIVKKDATCLDCGGFCFLVKDSVSGEFIYNSFVSQFFSNAVFDSCGVGIDNLLVQGKAPVDLIQYAVIESYLSNICAYDEEQKYFLEDRKIELLLGLRRKKEFLEKVANSLLKSDFNEGIVVLWNDFDINRFPNFNNHMKNALVNKNFFVLSDLFMLMLVNNHMDEMTTLWQEIEKQKDDFPEYYERLQRLKSLSNLPSFGDYYEAMYFD